jgi:hypothetical protein
LWLRLTNHVDMKVEYLTLIAEGMLLAGQRRPAVYAEYLELFVQAAVQPAREAVKLHRQAAAASGDDVVALTTIAQLHLGLSHRLFGAVLYAEAAAAAQVALGALHGLVPSPEAAWNIRDSSRRRWRPGVSTRREHRPRRQCGAAAGWLRWIRAGSPHSWKP